MSWVQSKGGQGSAATLTVTFTTANVQAGNTLVAYIAQDHNTVFTPTSVQDAALNSFHQLGSTLNFPSATGAVSVWALNVPAGDVGTKPAIKVTFSASFGIAMVVQEVSGIATATTSAGFVDGTIGTNTGTATPATSGAYSTTAAGEFLVGVYGDPGTVSTIPTSLGAYTADTANPAANTDADIVVGYINSSTSGSQSFSWAFTGTNDNGTYLFAFKPAAAAGAAAAQVTPAEIILAQYGLDGAFIVPAPSLQSAVNGSAVGVSPSVPAASGYTSALPTPPPVTAAELILAQYGFDRAFVVAPQSTNFQQAGTAATVSPSVARSAGVGVSLGSGVSVSPSVASATGYTTALATPAQVTVAQLVLAQYGFEAAFAAPPQSDNLTQGGTAGTVSPSVSRAAGVGVNLGAGIAVSPSVSSATGYTTALPTPAQVTVAELILAQYGLDGVFQVPAPSNVSYGTAVGLSPSVALSAGGTPAASTAPPVEIAELILDQYGLGAAFQVVAPSQAAAAPGAGTAVSVSPSVARSAGVGISLGHAVALSPSVGRSAGLGVGLGSAVAVSPSVASATGYTTALPTPPPVTVAQEILHQYGFEGAFQVPAPSNTQLGHAVALSDSVAFAAGVATNVGGGKAVSPSVSVAAGLAVVPTFPSIPAAVTPAELILRQYGLDGAFGVFAPPLTTIGRPSGLAAVVSPTSRAAVDSPAGTPRWDVSEWDESFYSDIAVVAPASKTAVIAPVAKSAVVAPHSKPADDEV